MQKEISIDGIKLTPLTPDEAVESISALLEDKDNPETVTYLNAYVYCLAKKDPELQSIISDSRMVFADGVSIVWATFLMCRKRISRCIMTHVFDKFLVSPSVPASRCILIGLTKIEVMKAQENMNSISENVQVVKAYSGYHSMDIYSRILKENHNIDVVLIGMSTPKSEYLCRVAMRSGKYPIVWHIGAGTIKCYAKSKRRPPEWVSKMGLEWVHRFVYEKHTRKRYIKYNFLFMYLLTVGTFRSIMVSTLLKQKK